MWAEEGVRTTRWHILILEGREEREEGDPRLLDMMFCFVLFCFFSLQTLLSDAFDISGLSAFKRVIVSIQVIFSFFQKDFLVILSVQITFLFKLVNVANTFFKKYSVFSDQHL